jgi:uncharacterized protein
MGTNLYVRPDLKNPRLIACWPGIGNIGLLAVDSLKSQLQANELGDIEPWDFFYPRKAVIKAGILDELKFPTNNFYYKRLRSDDLIFFLAEEQPGYRERPYAEGDKAYRMANMVLDVAETFGCRRVYTSGAAVSLSHHGLNPRVWAVTTSDKLNSEIKKYSNTVLMSEIEGRGEGSTITGLNGILLGVAKKRGLEAVCLMGEIPDYLSAAPFPYPKAARSIVEVFSQILGVQFDYHDLDASASQVGDIIDGIFDKLPAEIKEKIGQRKLLVQPQPESISEEDGAWIKEHIDEFFRGGKEGNERPA